MGPDLPEVLLGSPYSISVEIGLSDVIEPLQSSLLSSTSEQNFFTSAESISSCVELLAEFGLKALQPGYDPLLSVDFLDRAKIQGELMNAYKNKIFAASEETGTEVLRFVSVQKTSCHSKSSRHRSHALI